MTTETTPATPSYSDLFAPTIATIKGDLAQTNKWASLGAKYAAFFPTEDGLKGVKADIILHAIIPAFSDKDQAAWHNKPVRKGSKEYDAMTDTGRASEDDKREARKNVNAKAEVYFARIVKYAFPKPAVERGAQLPEGEGESKGAEKSTGTKIMGLLTDALGKAEKWEDADVDIVALTKAIKVAQAILVKYAEPTK